MRKLLDRKEIEGILPHRTPFLFVDSISAIDPGRRIVGEASIKYLGRNGSVPATLVAEAMAQVGAILVLYPEENRGKAIYFRSVDEAAFHRPLRAGTAFRVVAEVARMKRRIGTFVVSAYEGEELAAKGVMSFALG